MIIDPANGRVMLPSGFVIHSELTREEFLSTPAGAKARSDGNAAALYLHGRFDGGRVEDHPLFANACFFDELLLYLDMTINLYPAGATDWSSYSLDTEAAIKSLHDRLLSEQLGGPTRTLPLPLGITTEAQRALTSTLVWEFAWGQVSSSHDSKGGGTSMNVRYGNRLEEANKAYRKRTQGR